MTDWGGGIIMKIIELGINGKSIPNEELVLTIHQAREDCTKTSPLY